MRGWGLHISKWDRTNWILNTDQGLQLGSVADIFFKTNKKIQVPGYFSTFHSISRFQNIYGSRGFSWSATRVGKQGNYPEEKHWVITGEKGHRVNTPRGEKPKFGKFSFYFNYSRILLITHFFPVLILNIKD